MFPSWGISFALLFSDYDAKSLLIKQFCDSGLFWPVAVFPVIYMADWHTVPILFNPANCRLEDLQRDCLEVLIDVGL